MTDNAGTTQIATSTYNARGQLQAEYFAADVGQFDGIQSRHYYDALGRETQQRDYFKLGTTRTYHTGNPNYPDTEWYVVNIGGWLSHSNEYTFDGDGRVQVVLERGRTGGWVGAADDNGTVDPATVDYQTNDLSALSQLSRVSYTTSTGSSGFDAAGRLTTYSYQHLAGATGTLDYTNRYTYGYEARDTYLEKTVSGSSTDSNYYATTTTSIYDPSGRRVSVQESTPVSGQSPLVRLRYFSYDAQGGILTRRDGTLDNGTFDESQSVRQHYAYANGQQVAHLGQDGTMDVTTQLTAFDSSQLGTQPAMVLEGDTLRSIAQRVYGNPNLWYVLAEANAVTDTDLVAGTTLKAPQVKTASNDAATFKPYDPNQVIGATTPSLPYIAPPSRQEGCDAMATVIRLFVAVVVVMSGQWYAAAAVAGIGETAAQNVEIDDGYRDHYNWGQVGASAIMAGIGAGAQGGTFASWGRQSATNAAVYGAAMASASYVASYAINRALGQEDHFSWRQLATSAVAAGISAGVFQAAPRVAGTPAVGNAAAQAATDAFSWKAVALAAVKSVGRQAIGYGVQKAFLGQAHWNNGQVLGNAITDAAVTAGGMVANARAQAQRQAQQLHDAAWADGNPFNGGVGGGPGADAASPPAMGGVDEVSSSTSSRRITIPGNGDMPRSNAINVDPGDRSSRIAALNAILFNDPVSADISDADLAELEAMYRMQLTGEHVAATTLDTVEVIGHREAPASWMNAYGEGNINSAAWRMAGVRDAQRPPPGFDRFGRRIPTWASGIAPTDGVDWDIYSREATELAFAAGQQSTAGSRDMARNIYLDQSDQIGLGIDSAEFLVSKADDIANAGNVAFGLKFASNGELWMDYLAASGRAQLPVNNVVPYMRVGGATAATYEWGFNWSGAGTAFKWLGYGFNAAGPAWESYTYYSNWKETGQDPSNAEIWHLGGNTLIAGGTMAAPRLLGPAGLAYTVFDTAAQSYHYTPIYPYAGEAYGQTINGWKALNLADADRRVTNWNWFVGKVGLPDSWRIDTGKHD